MKVWSFQTMESWQKLKQDGVLRSVKEGDFYLDDFVADQMAIRIGPPPVPNLEPLWGWHRCRKTAVPARSVNWLTLWEEKEIVRLEIEMPRSQVLLNDFNKYENLSFFSGFVPGGNWGQLYAIEKDLEAAGFINEILIEGIEIGRLCELQKALNIPDLERKQLREAREHPEVGPLVRKSWEIMFDVYYRNGRLRHEWLQATFWELRPDQVVGAYQVFGKSCRRIKRW